MLTIKTSVVCALVIMKIEMNGFNALASDGFMKIALSISLKIQMVSLGCVLIACLNKMPYNNR